ncbi:STAS domain-containing protein [Streptomyces sp. NPDC004528]|uniref:STAS domain-containing protein n=1 Tax=Streptomyces sp. NPDC004528 TaxID=3154550 RepID=UPI0033B5A2FD
MTQRTLVAASTAHSSGVTVLTAAGELDYHTAGELRAAVDDAAFTADGTVIDLSGLTYCDSTGLTVLVTAYQRAEAAGSPLALAGLSADLIHVFEIVGLDQLFTLFPTVEEAVASLRP